MFFWVLNVSLEAYMQVSNQIEFVIFFVFSCKKTNENNNDHHNHQVRKNSWDAWKMIWKKIQMSTTASYIQGSDDLSQASKLEH